MWYVDMRTALIVPTLLACVLHLGAAEAEPLQGAEVVLKAMALPAPATAPDINGRPTSAEVAAFAARPDRDAAGWLALAGRFKNRQTAPGQAQVRDLVAALPGPAAWPALNDGLLALAAAEGAGDKAKRRAVGWQLLAGVLTGDRARQAQALATVPGERNDEWLLRPAREALLDQEDDPAALLREVEARIAAVSGADANEQQSLILPDLVSLFGAERATALLRTALVLPVRDVQVGGTRTRALAARTALALVADLKFAPWGLCTGPEALELFPALDAKFPAKKDRDWQRERAQGANLTQLVASGRTAEVVAKLTAKDGEKLLESLAWDDLAEKRPVELADTVRDLLKADPTKPLWSTYARLAGMLGRADELKAMVRDHGAAAATQDELVTLLLAADEVEPAIAALRARLAAAPRAAPTAEEDDERADGSDHRPGYAGRLIRLGLVLERPELVEEGCTALAGLPPSGYSWELGAEERTFLLLRAGRPALAERLLEGELRPGPRQQIWDASPKAGQLAALVRLYAAVGRPADALQVVERAIGWHATDLAQVSSGADPHEGRPPLAVPVAEALLAAGRRAEALRCALLALDQAPACDAAYALLLRIDPAGAPAVLARLQRRDALEDRPLLWLAQLQLDGGDAATAAVTAKVAVDLDPSDGDQGPDDRMRARAVLAAAFDKLGRGEEAKPLRTAIAAIRAGERADRLERAGLSSRAAAAYAKSLEIRDKTYCVQSRLAVTLSRLGRNEEAAVHFRRAFELMPVAFGRRESHCFGCEGVFAGVDARRIAEEVFTGLIAKDPNNAKHQYLLGYLRATQDRPVEAAAAYRAAVRLDPGYYSALEHLLGLDQQLRLPRAERQDLALALARLDPGRRHGDWKADQFRDPAVLWKLLEERAGDLRLAPEAVLPLAKPPVDPQADRGESFDDERGGERMSPSIAVVEQPITAVAISFIDRGW